MSDPFEYETSENVPDAPTTYEAPSKDAVPEANAKVSETSCTVTLEVPVGGKGVVPADAIDKALRASIGAPADSSVVVMPTGYTVVGAHSCNPTGASIGLRFGDSENSTHIHIAGKAGKPVHYGAVLSNRFHPSGDLKVPVTASKLPTDESIEERVEIAKKWHGLKPEDLMVGVQKSTGNRVSDGKMVTSYSVPLTVPTGKRIQAADGVGPDSIEVQQQPLAWAIEKNIANFGDRIRVVEDTSADGIVTDHFIVNSEDMETIAGNVATSVWNNHETSDINVSAHALGKVTGDKVVTLGLRVDADVLTLCV